MKLKKFLSILIVLIMVVGTLPMSSVAAADLSWNGGTITLASGTMVGNYTLTTLSIYNKNATSTYPTITGVTQDGNTINITLAEGTDPSYPLQMGFSGNGGYVQNANNTCTLNKGKGTATVAVQAKEAPAPNARPLGTGTFIVNFSVEMGEVYNVTTPTGEGFTFVGESTVGKNQDYTFTISINEGYDGTDMVVKVNDKAVKGNNGTYTVTSVTEELSITVEGISKKEILSITPPRGEGFTFSGNSTVYKGENYTFTIAIDNAYNSSDMTVKANDTEIQGDNGIYTITEVEEDTVISVIGIVRKNSYVVTFSQGDGYIVSGQATSYENEPYTFNVTVASEYLSSSMVVKVNDEEVILSDGSYTIPSLNNDTTITVEGIRAKEIYSISKNASEGVTISGEDTVLESDSYTFTVIVDEKYDISSMKVTINGTEVSLDNNKYTIPSATENLSIEVSGVVKKPVCEIIKPTENKFTFIGDDFAYKGNDYTFTVTPKFGYTVTVTANDQVVIGTDNTYTVVADTDNLVISVSAQRVALPETELNITTEDDSYKVDVTDNKLSPFSKYHATVTDIKISGAKVTSSFENGTTVYFTLHSNTNDDANLTVEFLYANNNCTLDGNVASITLEGGEGGTEHTVTANYKGMRTKSAKYTLVFFRDAPLDTPPLCIKNSDEKEAWKDVALNINLSEYFEGADNYYLVDGDNKTALDKEIYEFISDSAGEYTLEFSAENKIGKAEENLTVIITVKEVKSGVYIGHNTTSGALNYAYFLDENDNLIEGIEATYSNKEIEVILPKTYPANGKVKAIYNLSQNESGYPFLSTKTDKVGASPATKNKFTEKQTSLNKGMASFTFYYFNSAPTGSNQETFNLTYKVKNEKPTLADGIPAGTDAVITAGETYTLDLSSLFKDSDEDILTYNVSINEEAKIFADTSYTFSTDIAGVYTLVFTANDSKDDSIDTYTVTLTVENSAETNSMTVCIPEGLNPVFYICSGFNDGIDKLEEPLEAKQGETSDGTTSYMLNYPVNAKMLSIRTEKFGGMAFSAEKDDIISLRKAQFKVVDYDNNETGSTNSVTYEGNSAVAGSDGWLLVTGCEYVFTATPQNSDLALTLKTLTVEEGKDVFIASIMLGINNPMSITVPTGAKAQLYKYNQYYSNTEIEAKIINENSDGTTTFLFIADTKNGTYIYRVSMDGKITKAGWTEWGKQNITVTYTETDKSPSYRLNDYSATGEPNSTMTEDSVLLNVNSRNHLNLSVDECKVLKAYRGWEIIPVSYNNYIIPPDFKFTIISGDDVISLTKEESSSACDSDWMKITPLKEGIAIIEVTYNAIMISGGSYDGVYGASDPARSGLVVVQVGEKDDNSVKFGIDSFTSIGTSGKNNITFNPNNKKEWDVEFDTLYFTEESGTLAFNPTASSDITEVSISHDKGLTWKTLEKENDSYKAEIFSGNNIIRVTTLSGTAYQIVRGDKIKIKYNEVSDKSNDNGIIEAGETIHVYLKGIHNPIPKMAGNYNPGYTANTDGYSSQHLNYTCNGNAIYGTGAQYNFITSANFVEIIMPSDGSDIVLSDGYIGLGVVGLTSFFDGGDSHRNIPDNGCTTRENQTTYHTRSILPEITISVGDQTSQNSAPVVRTDAINEDSIYSEQNYAINPDTLFRDPDDDLLTFTVSVNGSEATEAPLGYKFTPNGTGTYTLHFTATDGKETIEHTITLTVTERPEPDSPGSSNPSDSKDKFGLDKSEIAGYVTISFVDKGVRVAGETGLKYPNPLGTIISSTRVPFKEGEKITHVTKRLLDYLKIRMEYTGSLESDFYLGAICNFEVNGTPYKSMGEFDAGAGSGWMITLNKTFIKYGASEFEVKNGDTIKWQYTCQLGADIGDPFYSNSSSHSNKNNKKEETTKEEPKEEITKKEFAEDTFSDIKKDDWHYNSVKYVYENNLMQGTGNGFEPESKMSRAMLVTVLFRMANPANESVENKFSDVPNGEWYTDSVNWAAANGIVSGVSETKFAPDEDISREQMALIIYRFSKINGYNEENKADISGFADIDDVSDWAFDALCWANKNGIITGTSNTTLSPKDTATRAEVATVLMRFCENIAK